MRDCARCVLLPCVGVLLSACVYTIPRYWAQAYRPGIDSPKPAEPLRPALTECVTQHDPAHLYQLTDSGEYRISGWFVNEGRVSPVEVCMHSKGWYSMPTYLLMP
jgi:hypothetical protein